MIKYYIEFKTWVEGSIDSPWPVICFEETDDYRNRNMLSVPASDKLIKSIFIEMKDQQCAKFFEEYVPALILGTVVESSNENEIKDKLSNVFGYIEILGCCAIDSNNQFQIDEVMKHARY